MYSDRLKKRPLDDNIDPEAAYEDITDSKDRRFAILGALERQKRRPSDPSLFCCDYKAAERAAQKEGKRTARVLGGRHLCTQFMGMEVLDGRIRMTGR